jgi:threonine dehydrogenase-like Zn-dependent dehydrogenase
MGRGRDTARLCRLVGEEGRVLAMDIQPEALESTRKLLEEENTAGRARLILDGHQNIASYAEPGSVSCIAYNFGWLPGGDHDIFTRAETSVPALEASLALLKPGGIITLCVYYGRNNGYREKDAILDWLSGIDPDRYTAIVASFCNRRGEPPIPAIVYRV